MMSEQALELQSEIFVFDTKSANYSIDSLRTFSLNKKGKLRVDFYVSDGIRMTPSHGIIHISGIRGGFNGLAESAIVDFDANGWFLELESGGSKISASLRAVFF